MRSARGARPRLFTPSFVPRYPGRLPGGVEKQLTVRLRAFSLGQLRVFIDLEEPRDPLSLRAGAVDDEPTTAIGEFYAAIAALGDGALTDEPRRQVGPDLMGEPSSCATWQPHWTPSTRSWSRARARAPPGRG